MGEEQHRAMRKKNHNSMDNSFPERSSHSVASHVSSATSIHNLTVPIGDPRTPHLSTATSHPCPAVPIGNPHTPYLSSAPSPHCPAILLGHSCTSYGSSAMPCYRPGLTLGYPCPSFQADSYAPNTPTNGGYRRFFWGPGNGLGRNA